ncbi:MAG: diaminopimelate epimerase [Acidobacteriota bacterium]|nr:diaminopimelate epimerase [Acidobacteriota bacterium]
MAIDVIKAHAYGNDFLFVALEQVPEAERAQLARSICHRTTGVGADGLVFYSLAKAGASMVLHNADGGVAEVSGNAVRCLATIVLNNRASPDEVVIKTDAGAIPLTLVDSEGERMCFEAMMGQPTGLIRRSLDVAGEQLEVIQLSVGNPQCIVLGVLVNEENLERLGPLLSTHPAFSAGSNVELVEVQSPSRIRILIWERGVGPTASSGTGACASAVAAVAYGGASRDVEVAAPGGTQRVCWTDEGIRLTGWAEVVLRGVWVG